MRDTFPASARSGIYNARRQFLTCLTPRQIAIGAAWIDGLTQREIAEQEEIDQATVSRELDHLRRACARVGANFPEHPRVFAADEVQMTDRLMRSL